MKEKLLKLIGDAFSSFIFTAIKFPPMNNFAIILNSQKQVILDMSFMLGYCNNNNNNNNNNNLLYYNNQA